VELGKIIAFLSFTIISIFSLRGSFQVSISFNLIF